MYIDTEMKVSERRILQVLQHLQDAQPPQHLQGVQPETPQTARSSAPSSPRSQASGSDASSGTDLLRRRLHILRAQNGALLTRASSFMRASQEPACAPPYACTP